MTKIPFGVGTAIKLILLYFMDLIDSHLLSWKLNLYTELVASLLEVIPPKA